MRISQLQAAGTVVRFDYDDEQADGVEATCAGIVAWSSDLDYAVLRLADTSGRPALPVRHGVLEATLEDNVAVNVIQHPDGRAKRIGLRNNIVHGTTDRDDPVLHGHAARVVRLAGAHRRLGRVCPAPRVAPGRREVPGQEQCPCQPRHPDLSSARRPGRPLPGGARRGHRRPMRQENRP